jgi:ornithine carbamoyltransferase
LKRDFLAVTDFTSDELQDTFALAQRLKAETKAGKEHHLLKGRTLAMIFQKPSARTRISFEAGMFQLGGHALYLSPADIGLGTRESIPDVARVVSRFCNGIMARVFGHHIVEQLAEYANVPVINGLSDLLHPCQIVGDMLTVLEHKGRLQDFTLAYVGDGNNVANSWVNMASRFSFELRLGVPEGYEPDMNIVQNARRAGLSDITIFNDPADAVKDADVVYTDVWASMGQESEAKERERVFAAFQLNAGLLRLAKPDHIVMHCLPAHRGQEITDEVMDGAHSVVFDEAENRMHAQKAILVKLMKKG